MNPKIGDILTLKDEYKKHWKYDHFKNVLNGYNYFKFLGYDKCKLNKGFLEVCESYCKGVYKLKDLTTNEIFFICGVDVYFNDSFNKFEEFVKEEEFSI